MAVLDTTIVNPYSQGESMLRELLVSLANDDAPLPQVLAEVPTYWSTHGAPTHRLSAWAQFRTRRLTTLDCSGSAKYLGRMATNVQCKE